jgi:hypothetical protein
LKPSGLVARPASDHDVEPGEAVDLGDIPNEKPES